MPLYRVKRHVVYSACDQQTKEVWGIDRAASGLMSRPAPRDMDRDDPLRSEECGCSQLLALADGRSVTWDRFFEWLTEAEAAGYTLVSGFENLCPFSVLVLRGP